MQWRFMGYLLSAFSKGVIKLSSNQVTTSKSDKLVVALTKKPPHFTNCSKEILQV